MARFDKLAYELQSMILAQCDQPSLHALSLVCRNFAVLSNQFLYTNIDWVWRYHKRKVQHPPPLALFLRTLIECPRLASLVRRFRLEVDKSFNDGFKYMREYLDGIKPDPLDPQIFDAAMKLIYYRGFPDKGRWRASLSLRRIDAVIALILSQLDRLEELDLGMCLVHKSTYVGIAMTRLIMRRHDGFFSHLKKIKFAENVQGFEAVGMETDINQIVPCFYLPSLKELDITFSDTWSTSWPEFKKCLQRKPSASLTTLRLYRCDISPEFIGKFVSLAPALKVLHCGILRDEWNFEEADDESDEDSGDRIDFADLRSALLPAADTLEDLTIDVVHCEKNCDVHAPLSKTGKIPMGSLLQFKALRSLEIPSSLLLGETPWHPYKQLSDLLPPSIRYLTLVDDAVTWETYSERRPDPPKRSMQTIIDVLAEYLDPCARYAPLLQHITLVQGKFKPWSGSSLLDEEYINSNVSRRTQPEQLHRIAKQSGVGLSVSYYRRFDEGGGMYNATLSVYDPEKPDAGLVEHGAKPPKL
ncbi:hypothetical protein FQN54_004389 [Arachnomyces sp. PD_36]|nr:hypothetical protein FQN54_004389 [Arachnomyces sp. PD_36]